MGANGMGQARSSRNVLGDRGAGCCPVQQGGWQGHQHWGWYTVLSTCPRN
jgi:hypothetical protein